MRFGLGFDMFSIMFTTVFVLVIATFIVTAVNGMKEWNKNNNSPRLMVTAVVVSKRTKVSHHRGANHHHPHYTSTAYYITFQVESGDRMELHVTGQEYGMLIEGDQGMLSFQGTRYLGFERL